MKKIWLSSLALAAALALTGCQSSSIAEVDLPTMGAPIQLADQEDGYWLIYFGFTSCPDVCPTTMATLSSAMRMLPQDMADKVQVLLVSVDTERDELAAVNDYVQYFNPAFMASVPETETLDQLVSHFGAFYRKVPLEDSAMGYTMDHSAALYLSNGEGDHLATLLEGYNPKALAERIEREITKQNGA
ncbi:SCO family protein [Salinibius halmophilus]|uniref:SCO family protein n=1 Tax=Salinibius halmophilus TaxID=1853216 RepID=UPI000E662985|nr:SCO family protein [Salinibius halmophilus]